MQPRLVIFDLDETLVHAAAARLAHAPDFEFGGHFVYLRPHLQTMLEAIWPEFDVAVWSSASRPYVDAVVWHVFGKRVPLKFAWAIERCVQRVDIRTNSYVYLKDLRKVQGQGYRLEQILMVDDSPDKVARQPRDHIQVVPFVGDPGDRALLELPARLAHAFTTTSTGARSEF
ncbi:HAD family hydrolase [Roseateles terrae]|uniref:RNA polymerase II subunit A small phosphatase-like protein n=1 Tax=Roseateles terrae TaxID=431060 RepID=A0ABR6GW23_9BURK|nr:HAD family hydrolase [Roseateles terrae]MBB3195882.1 RNA polymerase II subunit A small phosphatase-like protein [Roseateles terrae]OWQ85201.1 hypothetical protein CDN98_17095 [Roseateles terrae]